MVEGEEDFEAGLSEHVAALEHLLVWFWGVGGNLEGGWSLWAVWLRDLRVCVNGCADHPYQMY